MQQKQEEATLILELSKFQLFGILQLYTELAYSMRYLVICNEYFDIFGSNVLMFCRWCSSKNLGLFVLVI